MVTGRGKWAFEILGREKMKVIFLIAWAKGKDNTIKRQGKAGEKMGRMIFDSEKKRVDWGNVRTILNNS